MDTPRQTKDDTRNWRYKKSRENLITSIIRTKIDEEHLYSPEEITEVLQDICRKGLYKPPATGRRPKPWWSARLAKLRSEVIRRRRRLTRSNKASNGSPPEWVLQEYKDAYGTLRMEIKTAKEQLHGRICDELDSNPWGDAYRLAIGKLKPRRPAETPADIEIIIGGLFPRNEPIECVIKRADLPHFSEFEEEELHIAAAKLRKGKSNGPDGIPAEVIQILVKERPQATLRLMNRSLQCTEFPKTWKRAELRLIPKEGHTAKDPKYRPICLLSALGKLLEHLVGARLTTELQKAGGISVNQHAYQSKKSTLTALDSVLDFADKTVKRGPGWTPAIILLDVANAFNSASWNKILSRLQELKIPQYLQQMIRSYLTDRILTYDGHKEHKLTSGVPQGSVLGPTLWNVLFDGVLRIEMPVACSSVGYADDLAVLIAAKDDKDMKNRARIALDRIGAWMKTNQLTLAVSKTKALICRGRRTSVSRQTAFKLEGHEVKPVETIKYLGLWLDENLNFQIHAARVSEDARKACNCLAAILSRSNVRMARRRIIATVIESKLLYGAEVWRDKMPGCAMKLLEAEQRSAALRIISGYCTISTEAALVLAGMIPIGILAAARRSKFKTGIRTPKQELINKWQTRWTNSQDGKWTRRLIPNILTWISRPHGEVNFAMAQLFSGHGNFGDYLKRLNKTKNTKCGECQEYHNAKHVLLACPKWNNRRAICKVNWIEELLIGDMIKNSNTWRSVSRLFEEMMSN